MVVVVWVTGDKVVLLGPSVSVVDLRGCGGLGVLSEELEGLVFLP